jgi:hypothetical protein
MMFVGKKDLELHRLLCGNIAGLVSVGLSGLGYPIVGILSMLLVIVK